MKALFQSVILIFLFPCKGQTNKIISLPMLTEVDTLDHDGSISTYRTDYFLIRGSSMNKDSIRLYAENNFDTNLLHYSQYDMKFYKESEDLNLEKLKKYTNKYKAVEDEKPIVIYSWFNGKLMIH